MTNIPNDSVERVRPTVSAGLIVSLLLGIAVLNLTYSSEPLPKPYGILLQGLNVRKGPSTEWNPPIGSIPADRQVELLARSPDGKWFKINYNNSVGWIFAPYTKALISSFILPVDTGPPSAKFVLNLSRFGDQLPLTCGKPIRISVTITNASSYAMSSGGIISVHDYNNNGQETAVTKGTFPPIQHGQTIKINDLYLTVTSSTDALHRLVIKIDPDGNIPDVNDPDTNLNYTYPLEGDC